MKNKLPAILVAGAMLVAEAPNLEDDSFLSD
jgi:hypothetical protein